MKFLYYIIIILITFSILFAEEKETGEVFFKRGFNAYFLNDLNTALRNFENAVTLQPNNPEFHFYLGKTYDKLKRFEEAVNEYLTTLKLNSDHLLALKQLGNLYFDQKSWENALKVYNKILTKNPKDYNAIFKVGEIYFYKNELKESLKYFKMANVEKTDDANIFYYLGRIYLETGEFSNAIDNFSQALTIEPLNSLFYYWRGNAYYAMGDFEQPRDFEWRSVEDFRKAVELGFNQARAIFMFGNTLLNRGLYYIRNNRKTEGFELLKKAVVQFKEVIKLDPNASNSFNNLGLAYLGINKLEEAIAAFQAAIRIEPTVSFFHNNLGDAYYKQGKFDLALQEWKLTLELEPEYSEFKSTLFGDERTIREKILDAQRRQ